MQRYMFRMWNLKNKSFFSNLVKRIMFIAMMLLLVYCDEVFEEDITDVNIVVLSPPDNLESVSTSVQFWWQEIDDIIGYQLQIVTPSFNNIKRIVLDSTLTASTYTYTLYPDTFEWRVKAINHSSETEFVTQKLIVLETPDLSEQFVEILNPSDGLAANCTEVLFAWNQLDHADDYKFEIRKDNWEGTSVINPIIVTEDSIRMTLDEGNYAWGVQAQNEYSQSIVSIRSLTIDTTLPTSPVFVSPTLGDTFELGPTGIELEWSHETDSGSPVSDSLWIRYPDEAKELLYFGSEYNVNLQPQDTGNYHIWIVPVDAAGNVGYSSDTIQFYVEDQEK